jgi:hypothetical protein
MLSTLKSVSNQIRGTGARIRHKKQTAFVPFDEQTRRSWATPVRTLSELPQAYSSLFPAGSQAAASFQYAVLTPTFEGFLRRENERLVYQSDGKIHIVENNQGHLVPRCFPFSQIVYVEMGEILLYAWIKIKGVDDTGLVSEASFRFNITTAHLFNPILRAIRSPIGEVSAKESSPDLNRFDGWAHTSYKFMSYARRSIVPGERVIQAVLQPEIRGERFKALGVTLHKMISPTHVTILTDKELISIKETVSSGLLRETRYGGVWTYVPLDQIVGVSLDDQSGDLFALSIFLRGGDRLESLLSPPDQQIKLLYLQLQASIQATT